MPQAPMSFYDTRPAALDEDNPDAFWWPTPPFAAYPQVQMSSNPLPCVLEALSHKKARALLTHFNLRAARLTVQMTRGQKPMIVQFSQFRSLALDEPIKPELSPSDPHADLLAHHPSAPVSVTFADGGVFTGTTVGHVELDQGLFLFPPVDERGTCSRLFIPKPAYKSFNVGEKVGEILVAQSKVTPGQINQVMVEQDELRKRKLGDVLVSSQIISPEQLLQAIDMQAKLPVMRLGESLVALGLITDAQLQDALKQQSLAQGMPLGELLVKKGLITRENLHTALAHKMGYPVVSPGTFPVERDALKAVPFAIAERLELMPLLLRQGRLVVAMEDPTRRPAISELEFTTQTKVVAALAKPGTVLPALALSYRKHGFEVSANARGEQASVDGSTLLSQMQADASDAETNSADDKPIEQSDNQLVRLINTMIIEAHEQGVSDIHIECPSGKEKIRIRFRKDGQLRNYLELPPAYRSALVARIKIMCDLDISERRRAQDGKINFAKYSPQHKLELRVATIPTTNSMEDVVMRLLAASKPLPLDQIGLSPANFDKLSQAVKRPYGMVLCVGPTGSGKTTTLHSALGHINNEGTKIWTAEDPVEITQPGLRQVQVNPKIDWTFAKALKSFLRADPDVIMVGEVRDAETAHMAIEASLTGHLVLSTLHTNSAPETITRLLDMGMDPFNFADSLLAVLAQRLAKRLCKSCKTSTPATQEQIDELLDDFMHAYTEHGMRSRDAVLADWKTRFAVNGQLMHHHSPGCPECDQRGFKGRVGLHELLTVSREQRRLIQKGARAEEIQIQAMKEGMQTLRQDGIEKVLQGLTTLEEVRAMSNN